MENENKEVIPTLSDAPKSPSMIEGAILAAERLKAENERMEKNIKQLQELKAFETLGGKTEGKPQEVKPVEVDPKDYARKSLTGKF